MKDLSFVIHQFLVLIFALRATATPRAGVFPRFSNDTSISISSSSSISVGSTSSISSSIPGSSRDSIADPTPSARLNSSSISNSSLACQGCRLQATERLTLTFPYLLHNVTSTVSVVPYITVFPNTTITTFETVTQWPNATSLNVSTPATTDTQFDGLGTLATWDWNGVVLTFPTTYVAYDPSFIKGGIPTPFTTPNVTQTSSCDQAYLNDILIPTNPPFADFVYPLEQDPIEANAYTVPSKIIDYLESVPEVISAFGGNDLHTCTTSTDRFQPQLATNQPFEVQKTSVLVLTTATADPIVRTASLAPGVPNGPGAVAPADNLSPTVVQSVEDTAAKASPDASQQQSVSTPQSGGGGTGEAIADILLGSSNNNPQGAAAAGSSNGGAASSESQNGGGIGGAIVSGLIEVIAATPLSGNGAQAAQTPAPAFPPTLAVGSVTLTANSAGQFVGGGQTLQPGGSAIIVQGSTLSLATNAGGQIVAVVNGKSSTISPPLPTALPALTVDGKTYIPTTSGSSTFYVIDGTTLKPGQVATIHGTVVTAPNVPLLTTPPVLTFDGKTYTATVSGGSTFFVVDGTTLSLGQVATIDGSTLTVPAVVAKVTASSPITSSLPKPTGSTELSNEGRVITVRQLWMVVSVLGNFLLWIRY